MGATRDRDRWNKPAAEVKKLARRVLITKASI
jgi:hypothetical protein